MPEANIANRVPVLRNTGLSDNTNPITDQRLLREAPVHCPAPLTRQYPSSAAYMSFSGDSQYVFSNPWSPGPPPPASPTVPPNPYSNDNTAPITDQRLLRDAPVLSTTPTPSLQLPEPRPAVSCLFDILLSLLYRPCPLGVAQASPAIDQLDTPHMNSIDPRTLHEYLSQVRDAKIAQLTADVASLEKMDKDPVSKWLNSTLHRDGDRDYEGYPPPLSPNYPCPVCRAPVKSRPVEVYALKNVAQTLGKAMGETCPREVLPPRGRGREWDAFFPPQWR
ncbi:hypothetical protein GLOTRDRAFT_137422 [Gloeophyllum trabeum ATCC 11539]|uniref:Uncharacterized protein n=1 Tax=Gloeophyllum trabeum (strain ATCC 11539 / FP-39264 / Madison 617) TaxID=670483 RepID=S7QAM6_GLOTA|nr:uncharacterized protein GLOTRDRAFT_137422 [Gloeophyllum trabeum ATCC 11539]EPQ56971.1 hypothetical protein GLOTRDRAFT_137422 [Gloeophyllum trabeum ATCC 11539]